MEKRIRPAPGQPLPKFSDLPVDYTKMVSQVFQNHFADVLTALGEKRPNPRFEVRGRIYPDEILLSVAIVYGNATASTSSHASMDFDPQASAPTAEDLLNFLVDAQASFFSGYADLSKPDQLETLAQAGLSGFEDVPFNWRKIQIDQQDVWFRVDKENPVLEEMTDQFLKENDPDLQDEQVVEDREDEQTLKSRLEDRDDD